MGLKGSVCVALFLSLNLLSLSIVTSQTCPDLSACASLLNWVNVMVGSPPPTSSSPCCTILEGLGAQAGACLCNATPRIFNINLRVPIVAAISTTLNTCGLPNIGLGECSKFDTMLNV
uniref:Hydrophobic seed protein domain-containing protein n=1 Tax=Phaseolus vulgaris TaxID=3885 RepID=V7B1W8_PHAVU|nr:hypothetical protein PHAVU_009G210600g [Phaseolus vulgaris]ESW10451.1 hypothetical protein PHAVU_009G210600g [Phaseolus vulgaris]